MIEGTLLGKDKEESLSLEEMVEVMMEPEQKSLFWASYIHSFEWLYDLKAAQASESRFLARRLMDHWLQFHHKLGKPWIGLSWRPDVVGYRIVNTLLLYDFFLTSASGPFSEKVLKSLFYQVCFLKRSYRKLSNPVQKFKTLYGIFMGEILFSKKPDFPLKALEESIKGQLDFENLHITGSPTQLFILLRDLINIRLFSRKANFHYPFLDHYIEKLTPIIRFLRHGNGTLMNFTGHATLWQQGLEPQDISCEYVDLVLSLADYPHRPPQYLSGFKRYFSPKAVLLIALKPSLIYEEGVTKSSGWGHFEWSCLSHIVLKKSDIILAQGENFLRTNPFEPYHIDCQDSSKDGFKSIISTFSQIISTTRYLHRRCLEMDGEGIRGEDEILLSSPAQAVLRFQLGEGVTFSELSTHTGFLQGPNPQQKWRFITPDPAKIFIDRQENGTTFLYLAFSVEADKPAHMKWQFLKEE